MKTKKQYRPKHILKYQADLISHGVYSLLDTFEDFDLSKEERLDCAHDTVTRTLDVLELLRKNLVMFRSNFNGDRDLPF